MERGEEESRDGNNQCLVRRKRVVERRDQPQYCPSGGSHGLQKEIT